MVSNDLVLTTVHQTKMWGPLLIAAWNSGDDCPACSQYLCV